jgi:predicted RNA-binding protein with PIN domain
VSLHYLLDGYNLLYALPEIPAGSWETKRTVFLQKLTKEAPHGKNRVTVVFDSRQGSGDRSKMGSIEIAFTSGETADDWISHYVRRAPNPRILVIVTDDQGLRRLIRGTGAKGLGTREFWEKSKKPEGPSTESEAPLDSDSITDEFKKKWL